MSAIIELHNVTRTLPAEVPVTLVREIDCSIAGREFVAIIGPSGSGKSSLLYLLGLLDRPDSGEIILNGQPTMRLGDDALGEMRLQNIGFVFQFHFLLPEFSCVENVMLPMRRLGRLPESAQRQRAEMLLEQLGLADHRHKLPRQLSGGQSQRVAIARALANDPPLILADEPTGNLDSAASQNVQNILLDLVKQDNRAVVVVTHDNEFANRASRAIRMVDGRIKA
jgi:lipoprotein-releasing system ATP-binding protein